MHPSQSRHLSLLWLDRPQAWLERLAPLLPQDPPAAWSWLVSHHQLLTLAKRSEREVGLSTLWFAVVEADRTLLLGAALPGHRVALVPPAATSELGVLTDDQRRALRDFLQGRLKVESVMGAETALREFDFLSGAARHRVLEKQTSWGKRLTNVATEKPGSRRAPMMARRAGELDRPTINRWARGFATDTKLDPDETTTEVSEWLRRGRLLIFETDRPVGMLALSGEYTDSDFGRLCRLSLIYIDPIYRGRGYGADMMNAVENEVRMENANALILYSDPENARTKRFYSSLGFVPSADWIEVRTSGFSFI